MYTKIEKPIVQLTGEDGNIFNLMGLASRALKRAGQATQAREMLDRVMSSKSYEDALNIISDYCDIR